MLKNAITGCRPHTKIGLYSSLTFPRLADKLCALDIVLEKKQSYERRRTSHVDEQIPTYPSIYRQSRFRFSQCACFPLDFFRCLAATALMRTRGRFYLILAGF